MKKMRNTKSILLLTLVVVIVLGSVSGTLAYLIAKTEAVENIFQPAYVTSSVSEPDWVDGATEKKNVQIQNTGNIDANIRAAIVVTWKVKTEDGSYVTLPEKPVVNTDFTIDIGDAWEPKDWTPDGYYYYKATVAPNGFTSNLINSCKPINKYDDGRVLCVEVIGSAMQDQPVDGERWQIPQ